MKVASLVVLMCGLLAGCHAPVEYIYGGVKEPIYPPMCWAQPPTSQLWYPCGSEELRVADCVQLMELAMKAVDPYVPTVEQLKAMPILQEEATKGTKIVKLWDRAKNSCWSDLKDAQPKHYH